MKRRRQTIHEGKVDIPKVGIVAFKVSYDPKHIHVARAIRRALRNKERTSHDGPLRFDVILLQPADDPNPALRIDQAQARKTAEETF